MSPLLAVWIGCWTWNPWSVVIETVSATMRAFCTMRLALTVNVSKRLILLLSSRRPSGMFTVTESISL